MLVGMTAWPALPYARWKPTGASLQMWAQIVGKFRLARVPWVNHSWHATLYVNARGLTTGLVPGPDADVEVTFDFLDHRLVVQSTAGTMASFALEPMSVSRFLERFLDALASVGAPTAIHPAPNEVPDPIPFRDQIAAGAYDDAAAADFWRALVRIARVFEQFRK
jgi:hypothetical protein